MRITAALLFALALGFVVRAEAKKLDLRASELYLHTLDAKDTKLAPYAGKKLTLVNLWATWCGPCRQEMPALEGLHKKYGGKGFQVVGIDMDEDAATVKQFLAKKKVAYPIILSTPRKTTAALGSLDALPTSLLLDQSGDVLEVLVGAVEVPELEKSIEAYLAGKPPPPQK